MYFSFCKLYSSFFLGAQLLPIQFPDDCPCSRHSPKLSTLHSLQPANSTGLGSRNPLAVHLSDLSNQLYSVGANHAFNLFPLLARQLHTGSLPSMLQVPFQSLSGHTHCSTELPSGFPHKPPRQKAKRLSQSQLTAAHLLCPTQVQIESPSLSGALPVCVCCCSCGCAAHCVCVCVCVYLGSP